MIAPFRTFALAVLVALQVSAASAAEPATSRTLVPAPGGATIEVIAQGAGPSVVLLPSRGRGAAV